MAASATCADNPGILDGEPRNPGLPVAEADKLACEREREFWRAAGAQSAAGCTAGPIGTPTRARHDMAAPLPPMLEDLGLSGALQLQAATDTLHIGSPTTTACTPPPAPDAVLLDVASLPQEPSTPSAGADAVAPAAAAGAQTRRAEPSPAADAVVPAAAAGAEMRSSEASGKSVVGYIVHVMTGLFIHPQGGAAWDDRRLIFGKPAREPQLQWTWHSDGSIQNALTHVYLHPRGGRAEKNVLLVTSRGSLDPSLRFKMHADGCIEHLQSGMFIHPRGGGPRKGVPLVLYPGGHEPRLQFRFLPVDAAEAILPAAKPVEIAHIAGAAFPGTTLHSTPVSAAAASAAGAAASPTTPAAPSAITGYLMHMNTGLFVHPEGGVAWDNARLVLQPEVHEIQVQWTWHPDGRLENALTHVFVHPAGGKGVKNARLISNRGGFEPSIRFKMHEDGCIEHMQSGLFVHPQGGRGGLGVPLLLHPGGGEARLRFKFIPA